MKKNLGKNCIICKAQTREFARTKGHIIYKCKNCAFGYTDSLNAQSGEYHRDKTYIQEEKLFENIFSRRVKEANKFIKNGKVLEVGCSTGLMLSLFQKKGFDITGVEISKKAAEIAQERGVKVFELPFEKIKFSEKYDLVIFNHTLEHLEDPLKALEKAKSILTPKGYLMIDLPNFDSPLAKILKSGWEHLLPDEHLWHFTTKSFQVLFKKMDFKILKINRSSGIWDLGDPYKEIFHSFKGLKKRFVINVATAIPSLIFTKLNKGSDLLIIARKR